MAEVSFILNGKPITVSHDGKMTLLRFLRGAACMKGTKEGCDTGHCGACTVLVDGKAMRSCVLKMSFLEGKRVETIEGIGTPEHLHPIQKAFLEMGAIQCGFCTPGMIMAVKGLLDANPRPTKEEIYKALKRNYCRCTGYVKIIEAVELAAAYMRGETPDPASFKTMEKLTVTVSDCGAETDVPSGSYFGRCLTDMDGVAKATGSLRYSCDYEYPDMRHGAFVWSQRTCAEIVSVDYTEAAAVKGVRGIVTAKDVPGKNLFACFNAEQPVFCTDEVNFLGDMIALVVADTEEIARAAAGLVKVEYRDREGCYSIRDGLAAQESDPRRIIRTILREQGDVARAKECADIRLSASYEMERVDHAALEPVTAVGVWHAEDESIEVVSCTQAPFEIRNMLTGIMDLPAEKIRVVAAPIGGGFGKKCDSCLESAAAVAAYALHETVRIRLTREEDLLATTKRHAFETQCEIGVNRDGTLQYIDTDLYNDAGPYTQLSNTVLEQAMLFAGGPYYFPNIRLYGQAVRTNNVLGGAFRGYGINQGVIGVETLLDEAAEKLGISPFEIRRRNALRAGLPTVGGEILRTSVGIGATIDECEKAVEREWEKYSRLYPQGNKVLGVGMASGFKNVGVGKGNPDDGGCIMTILEDGKIDMKLSGTDMGQGFRTAMTQLACERLGRQPEDFNVFCGDTAITLPHRQSVSERQTLCTGRAVVICADMLLSKMKEENWEPGKTCTASYYHRVRKTHSLADSEARENDPENYRNYPAYAYLSQAAFVEVDKDTGKVRVLKVISCNDAGRVINPMVVEGQIEGSCSMGIGYATSESYPSVNGVPTVKHYDKLGVPTIDETPEYEIIAIEDPDPEGPYGAKGLSEVATVPITPAIMNAISRAVGKRFTRLPILPEDILSAIE